MKIGLGINYAGGFKEVVAEVADLEKAGLDVVFVPEAYSFDAISALGYLAAATERVELASGVLQLYTRTPTLTAMTAAGLDYVSDGRYILGLGASGESAGRESGRRAGKCVATGDHHGLCSLLVMTGMPSRIPASVVTPPGVSPFRPR